jgi:hypothetical protein
MSLEENKPVSCLGSCCDGGGEGAEGDFYLIRFIAPRLLHLPCPPRSCTLQPQERK